MMQSSYRGLYALWMRKGTGGIIRHGLQRSPRQARNRMAGLVAIDGAKR